MKNIQFFKVALDKFGCLFSGLLFLMFMSLGAVAEILDLKPKNTLTVIELDHGDEIRYELASGRTVHLKLLSSETNIVFSTTPLPAEGTASDASVFQMTCRVEIDGQEMDMVRFAPVEESFYVPYVVSGLRIWFDALKSLDQYYNENHGDCLPSKQVRLALHDATLPICPIDIGAWCPLPDNFPNVRLSYRGDDTWLGPYFGTDLHGGLDINMPANSPLWAPIPLDHNFYFNTVSGGQNNNRWRAFKHWDNGDVWTLQTHHHDQLLVPELQPISQGSKYAYSGGTLAGSWTHTHFVFKTKQPGYGDYYVDPWIIFWQTLEYEKMRTHALRAEMRPVPPAETGEKVLFDASSSVPGIIGASLDFHWSFGDGVYSTGPLSSHIYQRPGIYPVTLTVSDGARYATITHHIVVNGEPTSFPELRIVENGNPSFDQRPTWEMDVYNSENVSTPNTVRFSLPQHTKGTISPKTITVSFLNSQWFSDDRYSHRIEPIYVNGNGWLTIEVDESPVTSSSVMVWIKPDISKLNTQSGESVAYLVFNDNAFINSPQVVRVVVDFSSPAVGEVIVVDDDDANCIKSSNLWLTAKLDRSWSNYHGEGFLINSGISDDGFVRYHPQVEGGRYKISLFSPLYEEETIMQFVEGFYVNVRSKGGLETKWVDPREGLEIGVFDLDPCDGHVEIINKGSKGLVIADAIAFEKIF